MNLNILNAIRKIDFISFTSENHENSAQLCFFLICCEHFELTNLYIVRRIAKQDFDRYIYMSYEIMLNMYKFSFAYCIQ